MIDVLAVMPLILLVAQGGPDTEVDEDGNPVDVASVQSDSIPVLTAASACAEIRARVTDPEELYAGPKGATGRSEPKRKAEVIVTFEPGASIDIVCASSHFSVHSTSKRQVVFIRNKELESSLRQFKRRIASAKKARKRGELDEAEQILDALTEDYEEDDPQLEKEQALLAEAQRIAEFTPLERALGGGEEPEGDWYALFDLNVFAYEESEEEFDTPLKRKVHKRSSEYKASYRELRALRKKTKKSSWVLAPAEWKLGEYDTRRRGFEVRIESNLGFAPIDLQPFKSWKRYLFQNLPTKRRKARSGFGRFVSGLQDEYLFIRMSEEKGLEVEEQKDDVKVYVVFQPRVVKQVGYRGWTPGGNGWPSNWHRMTGKFVICRVKRIVVGNESTGEVFYERRVK